jgi:hypothetical protein
MPEGEKTKLLWKDPKYRKMMSDAHKGKDYPNLFKKGHKIRNTGRTQFKKGHRIKNEFRFKKNQSLGEKNINWKGDKVGYIALHQWLVRNYGKPDKCEYEQCVYPRTTTTGKVRTHPARFEWANIDGVYERERKHWVMLCHWCHVLFDRNKIEL